MEHGRTVRQFIDVPMIGQGYIKNIHWLFPVIQTQWFPDNIEE
jgi:hypothetical protein